MTPWKMMVANKGSHHIHTSYWANLSSPGQDKITMFKLSPTILTPPYPNQTTLLVEVHPK